METLSTADLFRLGTQQVANEAIVMTATLRISSNCIGKTVVKMPKQVSIK